MVEEKMASNQRDLAVFQHIMLENDICTETHSLTLKVLGMLKTCRTPDSTMEKHPHRMASPKPPKSRQVVNKFDRDDRKSDINTKF
jgi:hypothetical protein